MKDMKIRTTKVFLLVNYLLIFIHNFYNENYEFMNYLEDIFYFENLVYQKNLKNLRILK
jgi:hypothetical protein